MTTNESPNIQPLVDVLNSSDDIDPYAMIVELKPFLSRPVHEALSLAFDMCPVHDQDLDSCRDDASSLGYINNELYDVPLTACAHYWTR